MVYLEQHQAGVPGLFSKFQPASELALTPSTHSRLSDRLAPLGDRRDELLKLVENDRDNWGQRLRVVQAQDENTQDAAVAAFNLKSRPLVGVSDLTVRDGRITGSTHPTPQVVYATLSKRGAPEEILNLSKIMGTSGVLLAKDEFGNLWIQVQARNPDRNFPHGGNLGCSPAGLFRYNYSDEGTREEKIRRIKEDPESIPLVPVGSEEVARNIKGEAREELGIQDKTTLEVEIVGVAHDDTSPHFEVLTKVRSSQTPDQINNIAQQRIASLRTQDQVTLHPHDFTEAYIWMAATPENFRALVLTSPQAPATHIANWIAVGRQLVLEASKSEKEAHQWQTEVISELCNRVVAMGAQVSRYYETNPGAFFTNLHRKEQQAFAVFSNAFNVSISSISPEIAKVAGQGSLDAIRIKKYLDKIAEPSNEVLLAAAAMLQGVLHCPVDNGFDPRRTPEAQGLLSSVQTLEKLAASGVNFYRGTIELWQ